MKNYPYQKKILIFIFFIPVIFFVSCDKSLIKEKKELLIYCGITMIKPMLEIKNIIEKQENCKITITKGGSGSLLKSIIYNKVGDLFLPGVDKYIIKAEKDNLIQSTVFVGYNRAAIFVQKGNPKNITSDLSNFLRDDLYIIIGNPETGSIGKETKQIFEKKRIFEGVKNNARQLTTDSKLLFRELKSKVADLTINWYAIYTDRNNDQFVDTLPINEEFAEKKKLVLGLLKTSDEQDLAKIFMNYAASKEGAEIFKRYGFY
jgi:molybdate transport system substrate-binding protein